MPPPIGTYRHKVTVENPGGAIPDGDGGFIEGWTQADPATLDVSITPASTNDLERITSGTTLAAATHVVRGRHHPGITTASRLVFKGRVLAIIFVGNLEERDRELVMVAAEVLTPPTSASRQVLH